ncbi:hypothetical protein SAMN04489731_101707 [Amycolatopsis regifaucium]|nr:hypothetical protein SAMN04489731_101707 [Amycolatopsis regifaucium]
MHESIELKKREIEHLCQAHSVRRAYRRIS